MPGTGGTVENKMKGQRQRYEIMANKGHEEYGE